MGLPDFNALDFFIAVFVLLGAARGARTGLLAGVLSLVGLVVGASLGSRLAPLLLPETEGPLLRAGITLVSIVSFAVLGEVLARAVGGSLRSSLPRPASRVDGVGGAALGLALSLAFVWVLGVFALQVQVLAGLRPVVEESRVLGTLNKRIPSETLTRAFARLDPLPEIRGPRADVPEPDADIIGDPEVLASTESTVRVTGVACGYGVEGSGWAAAPDLVVTNAHVVAGEDVTRVQPGGNGPPVPATVVLFDPENDVAVLRVNGLDLTPLPLAEPESGEAVAVVGYPENGPLDIRAGRTGATRAVISGDAYNRGPVERTVTSFRVYVRPGNSGGPAVNADGEVVATIFASRADSREAGYGIPAGIITDHLQTAVNSTQPVGTGECVG